VPAEVATDVPRDGARRPALAAAVLGALTLAGYVALLIAEGDSPLRFPPLAFVLAIGGATAAAVAGGVGRAHRTLALGTSAVLFGATGLVGIFSIGLPLVVAAALAASAMGGAGRPRPY
jgi:hypothetical protein